MATPKPPPVVNPALYRSLGGPKRRYVDLRTGQEVSRSAAISGSTGFSVHKRVAANKAVNPEASFARPARGRAKAGYTPSSTAKLKPLRGKNARRVGAGRTAASYDRALAGLMRNPEVESIAVLAVFASAGSEKFVWLQESTTPDQVMSGREAVEAVGIEDDDNRDEDDELGDEGDENFDEPEGLLQQLRYADFTFSNFAFHVHFKKEFFRPKPPKAKRAGMVKHRTVDDNGVRVTKFRRRKRPGPKPKSKFKATKR